MGSVVLILVAWQLLNASLLVISVLCASMHTTFISATIRSYEKYSTNADQERARRTQSTAKSCFWPARCRPRRARTHPDCVLSLCAPRDIYTSMQCIVSIAYGLPTFMSGDVCVYYYLPPTQFQKLVRSTVHSDVCTAELIVSCFDQPLTESASRSRSNKRLHALSGCV